MKIIPAIDIRGGQVVRASGGDRSRYQPIESHLCPTGEPLPLAFALREHFQCTEVYLADLDALTGAPPDYELVDGLVELGLLPWVDAGIHDAAGAVRLRQCGAGVVAGSESIQGPEAWERIVRSVDARRLAFSLDLRGGAIVAPHWPASSPDMLMDQVMAIAGEVQSESVKRLFVIDLDRVGAANGVGTEPLLHRLVQRYPQCAVYAGGGIRGPGDIARLEPLGLAGVLVSSALHEGVLQPGDHS